MAGVGNKTSILHETGFANPRGADRQSAVIGTSVATGTLVNWLTTVATLVESVAQATMTVPASKGAGEHHASLSSAGIEPAHVSVAPASLRVLERNRNAPGGRGACVHARLTGIITLNRQFTFRAAAVAPINPIARAAILGSLHIQYFALRGGGGDIDTGLAFEVAILDDSALLATGIEPSDIPVVAALLVVLRDATFAVGTTAVTNRFNRDVLTDTRIDAESNILVLDQIVPVAVSRWRTRAHYPVTRSVHALALLA